MTLFAVAQPNRCGRVSPFYLTAAPSHRRLRTDGESRFQDAHGQLEHLEHLPIFHGSNQFIQDAQFGHLERLEHLGT